MGSAVLLLALAARQRQLDSQRRQREAARRRESDRRRREQNSRSGSYGSYSYGVGRAYSFDEHLRGIILEKPEHLEFVKRVYEAGQEIDGESRFDIEGKLEEMVPEILEQEKAILDLRKQIEDSGITITSDKYLAALVIDKEESRLSYSHDIGKHKYTHSGYPITFNGVIIDEKILEQDGRDYQEAYEQAVEDHPDVDSQLENERKQLKRQETIYNIPLMGTYSRELKIKDLKRDIGYHTSIQEDIAKKKKINDSYKSLTPEQKDLIGRYLKEIQKLIVMQKPMMEMVFEYGRIGTAYRDPVAINRKWEVAIERALSTGTVTEEQRNAFYDLLNAELQEVKTSYEDGKTAFDEPRIEALSPEGPVSWMVKHGAIEYARKEKERLKEEEKTLDETIELTEKRDDLIQGNKTPLVEDEKKDKEEKEEEGGRDE